MILVDVNLLVDATMTVARDHDAARSWLQDRLAADATNYTIHPTATVIKS